MKNSKQGCDKSCFMCGLCLKEWLPAIEANRRNISYKKGELIFKEGDPVNGMYFVFSGSVKVHKKWGGDKEIIIRIAAKGDVVGHRGLGADTIYPVSGTALEPVTVCFIDMAFFTNTLKVNTELLYQLMLFFASELKVSERKMRDLAHMPVKGRLAQALIGLQKKFGTGDAGMINIALSRQDLASYTGTTYETVFRMMQELVEARLIETEGKNIRILHVDGLQGLAEMNE
jgi:CRP-like cAMP-binding protein